MPLSARILTPIVLPDTVEVEIKDTIRGTTQVVTIDFHKAMQELGALGAVNLHEMDPAELITMASAVAKHRAIDKYLVSIGIDPHAEVKPLRNDG